jgi:hypothetical protein
MALVPRESAQCRVRSMFESLPSSVPFTARNARFIEEKSVKSHEIPPRSCGVGAFRRDKGGEYLCSLKLGKTRQLPIAIARRCRGLAPALGSWGPEPVSRSFFLNPFRAAFLNPLRAAFLNPLRTTLGISIRQPPTRRAAGYSRVSRQDPRILRPWFLRQRRLHCSRL